MLLVLRGPKPKQLKQRTNKRNALLGGLIFLQFLAGNYPDLFYPQNALEPRFAASMDNSLHIQRTWNPVSLHTCLYSLQHDVHGTPFRSRHGDYLVRRNACNPVSPYTVHQSNRGKLRNTVKHNALHFSPTWPAMPCIRAIAKLEKVLQNTTFFASQDGTKFLGTPFRQGRVDK